MSNIIKRYVQSIQEQPHHPANTQTKQAGQYKTSSPFRLNFQALRAAGYITPLTRRSRTGEEIRLIKRRLFQKMTLSDLARTNEDHKLTTRSSDEGMGHVIMVTSSCPAEGKSFLALNLALSIIIDEGYNVLLVDADVAKPGLNNFVKTNVRTGLTDLLRDSNMELGDVMQREEKYPLSYISAGSSIASATGLFGSRRMQRIISDMAKRYSDRIIIFDTPPLMASTEGIVLAQQVGQVVMTIDAQETARDVLEASLHVLPSLEKVSLVLNRATTSFNVAQFGSYYEEYHHARHGNQK